MCLTSTVSTQIDWAFVLGDLLPKQSTLRALVRKTLPMSSSARLVPPCKAPDVDPAGSRGRDRNVRFPTFPLSRNSARCILREYVNHTKTSWEPRLRLHAKQYDTWTHQKFTVMFLGCLYEVNLKYIFLKLKLSTPSWQHTLAIGCSSNFDWPKKQCLIDWRANLIWNCRQKINNWKHPKPGTDWQFCSLATVTHILSCINHPTCKTNSDTMALTLRLQR